MSNHNQRPPLPPPISDLDQSLLDKSLDDLLADGDVVAVVAPRPSRNRPTRKRPAESEPEPDEGVNEEHLPPFPPSPSRHNNKQQKKKKKKKTEHAPASDHPPLILPPPPPPVVAVERANVDFHKLQSVRMSTKKAFQKSWPPVIHHAVESVCYISKLACSLLLLFISMVFGGIEQLGGVQLPVPPASLFNSTFFEHLYKAVTWDTTVKFDPVLQYVRCIWLHALIVQQKGEDSIDPLDKSRLWTEISAVGEFLKEKKEKKKHEKDEQKRESNTQENNNEEEEAQEKEESEQKEDVGAGTGANKNQPASPLADHITKHQSLQAFLPSCKKLDQCIKYASKSYKASFGLYQTIGFRAHFGWYLVHKYRLKKKEARKWIEQHLHLATEKFDDEGDGQVAASDAAEAQQEVDTQLRAEEAQHERDEEDDDDDDEVEENKEEDTRLAWSPAFQTAEANRFKPLTSAKGTKNNLVAIVKLHLLVLRELETRNIQSPPDAIKSKLFALAPLAHFHRRFIRLDLSVLRSLDPQTKIASLADAFNSRTIRLAKMTNKGRSLAPTCSSNGVEVHILWQRPVTLSCAVDPKRNAAAAKRQQQKQAMLDAEAAGGKKADKRSTRARPLPILAKDDGPVYRKKTARLEEFTNGIFQTSSLLASRDAYLQAHPELAHADPHSPLHNLSLLPFRHIKSVDPGIKAPITSATWDHATRNWKKGYNLSLRTYYHEIGQRTQQMRMATRFRRQKQVLLTREAQKDEPARRVMAHMTHMSLHSAKTSSVAGCLSSLLYLTHCWNDMFYFYGSRNLARERFSSAQKKQQLIARIIERLAPASESKDTIIVLGSATFACSVKGAQSTPIGMLVKELSRVRRVVLVNEYFTTQMCSGCNLYGVGEASSRFASNMLCKSAVLAGEGARVAETLGEASRLEFLPPSAKFRQKKNHLHHPTLSMASFFRTVEPAHERIRREKRALRPPEAPPFANEARTRANQQQQQQYPTRRAIHGLKQCLHCGRYWERDYGAARNIGWVFIGLWVCGVRPPHLRRTLAALPLPLAGNYNNNNPRAE